MNTLRSILAWLTLNFNEIMFFGAIIIVIGIVLKILHFFTPLIIGVGIIVFIYGIYKMIQKGL